MEHIDSSMALPPQAPEILADLIRNQLSEIRQTEALESQVHEMVVTKRQKLVALMEQFLTATAVPAVSLVEVVQAPVIQAPVIQVPEITIGTAHQALRPVPVPIVAAPVPVAAAPVPIVAAPVPIVAAPVPIVETAAPIAHTVAAPLAESISFEEVDAPLPPNPSAQQVMDSLNRLMSGLKEISKTKQNLHSI